MDHLNVSYIVIALVAGVGIPVLIAAVGVGRVLERLDSFKELFESALAQWEHREGKQDKMLDDHETRLRQVERRK
jgi:hypothetical protein